MVCGGLGIKSCLPQMNGAFGRIAAGTVRGIDFATNTAGRAWNGAVDLMGQKLNGLTALCDSYVLEAGRRSAAALPLAVLPVLMAVPLGFGGDEKSERSWKATIKFSMVEGQPTVEIQGEMPTSLGQWQDLISRDPHGLLNYLFAAWGKKNPSRPLLSSQELTQMDEALRADDVGRNLEKQRQLRVAINQLLHSDIVGTIDTTRLASLGQWKDFVAKHAGVLSAYFDGRLSLYEKGQSLNLLALLEMAVALAGGGFNNDVDVVQLRVSIRRLMQRHLDEFKPALQTPCKKFSEKPREIQGPLFRAGLLTDLKAFDELGRLCRSSHEENIRKEAADAIQELGIYAAMMLSRCLIDLSEFLTKRVDRSELVELLHRLGMHEEIRLEEITEPLASNLYMAWALSEHSDIPELELPLHFDDENVQYETMRRYLYMMGYTTPYSKEMLS